MDFTHSVQWYISLDVEVKTEVRIIYRHIRGCLFVESLLRIQPICLREVISSHVPLAQTQSRAHTESVRGLMFSALGHKNTFVGNCYLAIPQKRFLQYTVTVGCDA